MKLLITTLTLLCFITSSVSWGMTMKDLVNKNGIYYSKSSDIPFTGKINEKNKFGHRTEGFFKDGVKEGDWNVYWDNGQLMVEGQHKQDLRVGDWTIYHGNGQIMNTMKYKNGKLEGKLEMFYFDGQMQASIMMSNGIRNGKCVYYNKDGTLMQDKTGIYKDGKKISD